MGRPKSFDRDEVLDRALELFWQRGYEATSIGDLVEHLGIGRQSLYDTYGDKHALYLAALDRYQDAAGADVRSVIEGPVRRAVRDLLQVAIEATLRGKSCMLTSAATERCSSDPQVQARFCAFFRHIEERLTERLERARVDGEIARHHDPRGLARFFANAIQGLQVTGKALGDRAVLEQVADVTVSILG